MEIQLHISGFVASSTAENIATCTATRNEWVVSRFFNMCR
jgi:hypothetical protein